MKLKFLCFLLSICHRVVVAKDTSGLHSVARRHFTDEEHDSEEDEVTRREALQEPLRTMEAAETNMEMVKRFRQPGYEFRPGPGAQRPGSKRPKRQQNSGFGQGEGVFADLADMLQPVDGSSGPGVFNHGNSDYIDHNTGQYHSHNPLVFPFTGLGPPNQLTMNYDDDHDTEEFVSRNFYKREMPGEVVSSEDRRDAARPSKRQYGFPVFYDRAPSPDGDETTNEWTPTQEEPGAAPDGPPARRAARDQTVANERAARDEAVANERAAREAAQNHDEEDDDYRRKRSWDLRERTPRLLANERRTREAAQNHDEEDDDYRQRREAEYERGYRQRRRDLVLQLATRQRRHDGRQDYDDDYVNFEFHHNPLLGRSFDHDVHNHNINWKRRQKRHHHASSHDPSHQLAGGTTDHHHVDYNGDHDYDATHHDTEHHMDYHYHYSDSHPHLYYHHSHHPHGSNEDHAAHDIDGTMGSNPVRTNVIHGLHHGDLVKDDGTPLLGDGLVRRDLTQAEQRRQFDTKTENMKPFYRSAYGSRASNFDRSRRQLTPDYVDEDADETEHDDEPDIFDPTIMF